MNMVHKLSWQVGHTLSEVQAPSEFVNAQVPGCANLDWINEKNLPDWKKGTHFQQYRWMEDCYWLYQTHLPDSTAPEGTVRHLIGKGIDYQYEIRLNGDTIYKHEGMFTPFDLDLTKKTGRLEILIFPAPKDPSAQIPQFSWQVGDLFTAALWMLNMSRQKASGGTPRPMNLILRAGEYSSCYRLIYYI